MLKFNPIVNGPILYVLKFMLEIAAIAQSNIFHFAPSPLAPMSLLHHLPSNKKGQTLGFKKFFKNLLYISNLEVQIEPQLIPFSNFEPKLAKFSQAANLS